MKILVYIKRVPATEARLKIADGGADIDPAGLKYVVSPYDEYALELALRLREARGEGEVVVATLGEPAAGERSVHQPASDGITERARVSVASDGRRGKDTEVPGPVSKRINEQD